MSIKKRQEIDAAEREEAETKAVALTVNERCLLRAVRESFVDDYWLDEEGTHLLFDGARNEREVFAHFQRPGHFKGLTYDDLVS